jgi:hypothetical protein
MVPCSIFGHGARCNTTTNIGIAQFFVIGSVCFFCLLLLVIESFAFFGGDGFCWKYFNKYGKQSLWKNNKMKSIIWAFHNQPSQI